MLKFTIIFVYIVLFVSGPAAQVSSAVDNINKIVSVMSDSIKNGNFQLLQCEDLEPSEGVPPNLKFYYKGDRLVAIFSQAGHESWSNEFQYFYYANGNIMKYLKITTGQSDSPVRTGVIYGLDGKILWKNVDVPMVSGDDLKNLFRIFQQYRLSLSKY